MSAPDTATPRPTLVRRLLRSILAGYLWIGLLFGIDLYDSYWRLKASARKVRTDREALDAAKAAILDYIQGVVVAHVILGLAAGLLVHFLLGLWFPREPGRRRWWAGAVVLCTALSVVFFSHDIAWYPLRHSWFPWREWYADHVAPPVVLMVWLGVGLGVLGLAARRWKGQPGRVLVQRLAGVGAVVGGWLLLTHTPAPTPTVDNDGPNVVIIGVDGLRPDHLRSYGYPRDTAPHIEAFLEDAVVFDQAWTVFARTYPSWTSILSGQMPIHHGIRDNLPLREDIVPDTARLLPQVLAEQGYHTTFITDDSRFSYMLPETGFQDLHQPPVGIGNFAISANEPYFRLFGALFYNPVGFRLVPGVAHNQAHGRTFRPLDFIDMAASALGDASQDDRFLYALHSCVLHAPGDRPWPWHQMYGQRGYSGSNRFRYNRAGTTLAPTDAEEESEAEAVSAQDKRLYDSGLDMADRLVARLMADLEAGGLLDNTIVVLLSDHGEESWEPELPYRYYGPNHGYHPYGDAQHRVLFAVRFPDGRGAGRHVSDPVRTIDLAPTLAEVLGLDWGAPFDGASLLPLVDGGHEATPRSIYIETGMTEKRYWNEGHASYPWKGVSRRYRVDGETGYVHVRNEFYPFLLQAKDRVLQKGPWKLVWRPMVAGPARVELFRRDEDPTNLHDVADEHPDVVAELGLELSVLLAEDGILETRAPEWAALAEVAVPPAVQALADEEEARQTALYESAFFLPPLLPSFSPMTLPGG